MNRARRWMCLLLFLAGLWLNGRAAAGSDVPLVDRAVLAQLESAANKKESDGLRRLTRQGVENDYEWVSNPPPVIGSPIPWRAKILTLPGLDATESTTFIGFSRYHNAESAGDHLFRIRAGPEGVKLAEEIPENDLLGTRVRHHRLVVKFDVQDKRAIVSDRVTIERHSSEFPSIILRINSIYAVSAVRRNGLAVPFTQAGGFIAVQPPSGDPGTQEISLDYAGTVDQSTEDYIRADEAALTGYWYPHTGRMPATSDVSITVPKGWSAIGQGEPATQNAATKGSATTSTVSWSNRLPVSYISVAAGRYTITTRRMGPILVSAWLLQRGKDRSNLANESIRVAGKALNWFGKNFGPFPYTRYAVVETDVFPAALECYSFTLVGSSLIPEAIVHEISHTWWGGVVPNTYTRSLWNESLAEYSDGLFGRMTGESGMHEMNAKLMAQSGFNTTHTIRNAKDAMDFQDSMLGYGKGSLVMENLERMIGVPKLLASLRRFISNHQRDRPRDDADWPDIVDAVAQTAGDEWRGFFAAWLDGKSLPTLGLRNVQSRREGAEFIITGSIVEGEPAGWIRVPLSIRPSSGAAIEKSVDVRAVEQPFRISVPFDPAQILLDPKRETLRAIPKKRTSTNLLGLQTLSGPLVAVYPTGGDSAETSAARGVAETQVRAVSPFATVTVRADTELSSTEARESNLLLVGRPENFKLPNALIDSTRLAVRGGVLTLGGRDWRGDDVWCIEVTSNPLNSRLLMARMVAANPSALGYYRYQADLDAQKSLFIASGKGRPLFSSTSDSIDSTVVVLKQ